jgi:hypothetical protein
MEILRDNQFALLIFDKEVSCLTQLLKKNMTSAEFEKEIYEFLEVAEEVQPRNILINLQKVNFSEEINSEKWLPVNVKGYRFVSRAKKLAIVKLSEQKLVAITSTEEKPLTTLVKTYHSEEKAFGWLYA